LNLLLILKYLSIFQNQIAQKNFYAPLNAVQIKRAYFLTPDVKSPYFDDFELLGLETTLSNAFCCPNSRFFKQLISTSLLTPGRFIA
jgi:hypothetical protein